MLSKIGRYLTAIIILVLMPTAFFVAAQSGVFRVHKVEVISLDSTEPVVLDYVQALKQKLSPFEGKDLWKLPMDSVVELANSESWISEVRVFRRLPQTLRVEVIPKPMFALMLSKKGTLHPVSAKGQVLPAVKSVRAPKLPVIQDSRIVRDDALRAKVVELLRELPEDGRLNREVISEVTLSREGEIWLEYLPNKSMIKMGDANVGIKSARVAKVLEYLDQNHVNWRSIDADFSKKVLVKLKNGKTVSQ